MDSDITAIEFRETSPLTAENVRRIGDDDRAERVSSWVLAHAKGPGPFVHSSFLPLLCENDGTSPTYSDREFIMQDDDSQYSHGEGDDELSEPLEEWEIQELFYEVVAHNAWTLMWE
ncbi:hypothetical protein FALCPG4_014470 [Fusarium falciforme]